MSLRPLLSRSVKAFLTRHVMCVGIVCGLLGCGSDATAPAPTLSESYWALQTNYHAVNMSTVPGYNTVHLTAVPLSVTGDTLIEVGPVTYSAKDSSITVDTAGLVTAHFTTARAPVVVKLQYQQVTLEDTVFIRVTDTVPQFPLATFSIQPQLDGLDSARTVLGFHPVISVYATNTSGSSTTDTVCNVTGCPLLVAFSSSDRAIAAVDPHTGSIDPQRPGVVTFYATTYAYGITRQDSLPFVIGWSSSSTVQPVWTTPVDSKTPVLAFRPAAIIVSVGAHIAWNAPGAVGDRNPPGDSVDVVFDDSTAVQSSCGFLFGSVDCTSFPSTGGGNIAPFFPDTAALGAGKISVYLGSVLRARAFPVEGMYTYHSRRYPSATGKIIVTSGL
jgi:hypothetical protein